MLILRFWGEVFLGEKKISVLCRKAPFVSAFEIVASVFTAVKCWGFKPGLSLPARILERCTGFSRRTESASAVRIICPPPVPSEQSSSMNSCIVTKNMVNNKKLASNYFVMKVLVTGSRGFVGKELVIALKKTGFEVREFDLSLGNDLSDEKQCEEAAKGNEIVFHLAAVLDEESPLLHKVNVEGTKNILEASAKARVKQFVFLSSVGVHGKAKSIVSEESPLMPETAYEKTKAEAEKIVLEFQETMFVTIIRSALILGANNYWKSIVHLVEKNFPLPGKADNIFQTIFIRDLVSAILFCANNRNCFGETFIVANSEKKTLKEICMEIKKILGLKGEIKTIPIGIAKIIAYLNLIKNKLTGKKSLLEPAYINRVLHERNYNVSKIAKAGWQPRYSTENALKETVQEIKAGGQK